MVKQIPVTGHVPKLRNTQYPSRSRCDGDIDELWKILMHDRHVQKHQLVTVIYLAAHSSRAIGLHFLHMGNGWVGPYTSGPICS